VTLCRGGSEAVCEEQPRLDENVSACDESLAGPEYLLGARVTPVAAIGCSVEGRGVDEERQRRASTASPM
jgi:hypothetical protein